MHFKPAFNLLRNRIQCHVLRDFQLPGTARFGWPQRRTASSLLLRAAKQRAFWTASKMHSRPPCWQPARRDWNGPRKQFPSPSLHPSIPPSLPRLLESSCILVAQGARFFTLNKDKSCKVRFPGLQNHTSAIWRAKRHKSEQGTPTRKAKHPTRVFLQSSGNSHSL